MGERTSYAPGTFCWVELATSDAAAARGFYRSLFGWDAEDLPAGDGMTYTMLRLGGRDVAGLYQQDPDERSAGVPPHWSSYVSVPEVDATAARVKELGGELLAPPFDVMDSGRMAVLRDPTGAVVSLWQPGRHFGAELVNDPGCLTMNELATPDPRRAADFYAQLLGWTPELREEYSSFRVGDRLNAGMREETSLPPHWLPYFTVRSLEEAMGSVRDGGGRLLAGPIEVPAGRIAAVTDPQGAALAFFEGEVDP